MTVAPALHPPEEILLGFARALRAAGMPVTADRERTYLEAVAEVGFDDQSATYWAGRAVLCSTPTDLERYDKVFTAWFSGLRAGTKSSDIPVPVEVHQAELPVRDDGGEGDRPDPEADAIRAMAATHEVLRHRDVASMSPAERRQLAAMFATLVPRSPVRRAHRLAPARRGRLDLRHTLRAQLRHFGEPTELRWRHRAKRPRRVVLLIDVSGSMSAYADALLRLAHRFSVSAQPVQVFTLGTRLTQVSRELRQPDADRALIAAGNAIPDWSGGTRLAQGIKAFLDRFGRRGMARGAVVVVFSDGWERDHPEALAEQMRRLRSLAHEVVWVNPHRGRLGYQPIQSGIVAALPHCDEFVAGHSLAAFEKVIEVVAHA